MFRTLAIVRRELAGYFAASPSAVVIIAFPALAAALTFSAGRFFARDQADLQCFFLFHPWLYLGLAPLLAMRTWSDERRGGTIELLLTLPARVTEAVVGKFLAAWCVAALALALTFPLWLTVNLLGHPDDRVILAGYLASWLLAGALLAIGGAVSAATRSRLAAICATAAIALLLIVPGRASLPEVVHAQAPAPLLAAVADAGLSGHFARLMSGLVELRDLVYFAALIAAALAATAILVGLARED
jgi:ABC-2 type transport system permease protein